MPQSTEEITTLNSLTVSETEGVPIRFLLHLPPNLEKAAGRNAVPVRIEIEFADGSLSPPEKLDLQRPYNLAPPHLQAGRLLETWCAGRLAGCLQLRRTQLKKLLDALRGEPVVFTGSNGEAPAEWHGALLAGVSEHLEADEDEEEEEDEEWEEDEEELEEISERPAKPPAPDINQGHTPVEVDGSGDYLAISLPSKEHPYYEDTLNLLRGNEFLLDPSSRKWWLRDRHKVLNFLAEHWNKLENTFQARFTDNFRKNTERITDAKITCIAREEGNQFYVQTSLKAGKFKFREIQNNINSGKNYVETPTRVFLISDEKLKGLEHLQRSLAGNHNQALVPRTNHRIETRDMPDTEFLMETIADHYQTPGTWKKRSVAIRDLSRLERPPIPRDLDEALRAYQRLGVAWMYHLYRNKLGGILADEMGLGKTIQALALLAAIRKAQIRRRKYKQRTKKKRGRHTRQVSSPFLVVCPAGLLTNWKRETQRFVPMFKFFVHHGNDRLSTAEEFEPYDLVMTSYTTLIRDAELFQSLVFDCIVADEAQHIKNPQTRNFRSICSLYSRGHFLLTGTPLENSLDDLVALFDFILPGYLQKPPANPKAEERAWYDKRIQQKAAPYILRRTKQHVAPELPDKIEQIIYCEMGAAQRQQYQELKEKTQKAIFELEMGGASEGRLRVAAFTQLLRLRQFCCDPRLLQKDKELSRDMTLDSAKKDSFLELVQESIDGGHRMLVFSQFVSLLQILREELDQSGLTYCYLDGQTRNRMNEVDRFNNTPDIPIFLISLKAGGTGLNLTGADTVIHYDPWWNPAVEAQATDRAHRIGQSRVVTSIKLIAAETIEEKVLELQRSKANLLKDLFAASESANAKISLDDIKQLLE